tara:strand:+ start:625 stop:1029 length:405 start_codon:yes stop_codon:yes gene_type:complete
MKTCKSGRHQFEGRGCPVCAKEKKAAYYAAHSEKLKAAAIARRVANPGYYRASSTKWRVAYPERLKAAKDRWYAANPERTKATQLSYRERLSAGYIAELLELPVKDVPEELMEAKRVTLKLKRLIKEMKNENAK